MTAVTHGPEGSDLAVLLERYAYLRLQPDPAAMARIRVTLVADAAAGRGSSGAGPRAAGWSHVRARGRAGSMRRIALAFAAALALAVAVAGSALAGSRPGGPLYELRLWVETLTLPATAEARVVAELGRAELRLAEAVEASSAGDRGAVVASLSAYIRIVDNELGLPVGAPGRANAAEQIARHEAVLVALLDDVPTEALPVIEAAISHSDHAIDLLLPGGRGQPGDESTRPEPPGRATDAGDSGTRPGNGDRTAPSSGTGSARPDGMDERSIGNGNARRPGSTPEPTHRPRPAKATPQVPADPGARDGGGAGGSRAGGGNAANGAGTGSPPAAGTGGSSSGGAKDGGTGSSTKQSQALASTQPPPLIEVGGTASRPQPAARAAAARQPAAQKVAVSEQRPVDPELGSVPRAPH